MSPDRAARVVPAEAVLTAETRVGYYGSAWMIFARMDGYERPVTQFASHDPFRAARWLADFEKCRQGA
jgi:hypothetical protein